MFGINMFSGTAGAYASLMKLQSRWDEKKERENSRKNPRSRRTP